MYSNIDRALQVYDYVSDRVLITTRVRGACWWSLVREMRHAKAEVVRLRCQEAGTWVVARCGSSQLGAGAIWMAAKPATAFLTARDIAPSATSDIASTVHPGCPVLLACLLPRPLRQHLSHCILQPPRRRQPYRLELAP